MNTAAITANGTRTAIFRITVLDYSTGTVRNEYVVAYGTRDAEAKWSQTNVSKSAAGISQTRAHRMGTEVTDFSDWAQVAAFEAAA